MENVLHLAVSENAFANYSRTDGWLAVSLTRSEKFTIRVGDGNFFVVFHSLNDTNTATATRNFIFNYFSRL